MIYIFLADINHLMSKNKKILVTGGAGFVGSNLIKLLLQKTKFNILSIDNYSSEQDPTIFQIKGLNIFEVILKIF